MPWDDIMGQPLWIDELPVAVYEATVFPQWSSGRCQPSGIKEPWRKPESIKS